MGNTLKLRDQLVSEEMELVEILARQLRGRLPPSIELDDLRSAGLLGLLDAAEKFDPSFNSSFKHYAEIRIRGAMLDELRRADWLPRSLRRQAKELEQATVALSHALGRAPLDEELAEAVGAPLSEIQRLRAQVSAGRVLFYEDMQSTEESALPDPLERIPDLQQLSPERQLIEDREHEALQEALKALSPRLRMIFSLRQFEELKFKEISELFGLSEARVNQLYHRARRTLLEELGGALD